MMLVMRMKRHLNIVLLVAVLPLVAAVFSGCKSGSTLFSSSRAAGSAKPANLPNEPDVTFEGLQGNNIPLASLKGKVVLVNFWATWCDPCKAEIPDLIGLQNKYGTKGFTVLGVSMDEDGKSVVQSFVQSTQFDVGGNSTTMNYPVVMGNDDIATKFGGLFGYPTSFLLTRDGKVDERFLGVPRMDTLEKEIQGLL
jgi:thiol-disulfide isomerase/thioredoxin